MSAFALISLVFVYTTVVNVVERPDGVKIGGFFIAAIVIRVDPVATVARLRAAHHRRGLRRDLATVPARLRPAQHPPGRQRTGHARPAASTPTKLKQIIDDNDLPDAGDIIFVEVTITDPSDFEGVIEVRGEVMHGAYRVIKIESPTVPNALAALLLEIRDATGVRPHIYFEWTEGNPASNFLPLPALRCRRGRSRHPGGAPPGGAPSEEATARPRRLSTTTATLTSAAWLIRTDSHERSARPALTIPCC